MPACLNLFVPNDYTDNNRWMATSDNRYPPHLGVCGRERPTAKTASGAPGLDKQSARYPG